MTLPEKEQTYQFKALTDLWTGSVVLKKEKCGCIKEKIIPDRLIATGLLGSVRWWSEVLVRGLGGSACDPNDTKCQDLKRCAVCELFGCTGWARKFRFKILNESDTNVEQIKKNQTFSLSFIPLRPIRSEEKNLLETTLRLIAEYGAIGGKTVLKPESGHKERPHNRDYGLVELTASQQLEGTGLKNLKTYLSTRPKLDHGNFAWASLKHFWCVKENYLKKKDFDKVLNNPKSKANQWLGGSRKESKKVFSFKNPPRTFGFVKPGLIDFESMKQRLTRTWEGKDWKFLTGDEIIKRLWKEDRP